MKLLVLIDRYNWAYHSITKGLLKYGGVPFDTMPIKGNAKAIKKAHKKYDRFLVMGWQNYEYVKFLPKSETLVGIHGHHAWDKRMTTPEKDVEPPTKLMKFLDKIVLFPLCFYDVGCVTVERQGLSFAQVYRAGRNPVRDGARLLNRSAELGVLICTDRDK